MMPTFKTDGDYVLINLFDYKVLKSDYRRGDVVICVCPYDPKKSVCKRIAATPGEKIWIDTPGSLFQAQVEVPKNHVWLLGDNSENSLDSRKYGFVPVALLKGKVICKIRPFESPYIHDIETSEEIKQYYAKQAAVMEQEREAIETKHQLKRILYDIIENSVVSGTATEEEDVQRNNTIENKEHVLSPALKNTESMGIRRGGKDVSLVLEGELSKAQRRDIHELVNDIVQSTSNANGEKHSHANSNKN